MSPGERARDVQGHVTLHSPFLSRDVGKPGLSAGPQGEGKGSAVSPSCDTADIKVVQSQASRPRTACAPHFQL